MSRTDSSRWATPFDLPAEEQADAEPRMEHGAIPDVRGGKEIQRLPHLGESFPALARPGEAPTMEAEEGAA